MKYHELNAPKKKAAKRVGRGISAGQGKTAGRGTKGQSARSGGKRRPGFEGGQTPLMMRTPKLRGFRSIRTKAETVYTGQINNLKGAVDNFTVFDAGLTTSPYVKVKLVVKGDLTSKVDIALQGASKPALEMIKKAGGTFKEVPTVERLAKSESK